MPRNPLPTAPAWNLGTIPNAGAPLQQGQPPPSIEEFALRYEAPRFHPQYTVPAPGEEKWLTTGNTVDENFDLRTVKFIVNWDITPQDWQVFQQIWGLPYNPSQLRTDVLQWLPNINQTHVREHVAPLQHHWPDFQGQFGNEAALTSRIDSSLWIDFTRSMTYIACAHEVRERQRLGNPPLPSIYPAGARPVYPDLGANAYKGKYLPDRCAKVRPNALPKTERSRLFGDIKPSYKFHHSWKATAQVHHHAQLKTTIEFKKVLAQLKFYMEKLGMHQDGNPPRSTRYGYILTDEEVVLVRRCPEYGSQSIQVSDGFPLRGPYAPGMRTGMWALIFIHLLASVDGTAPHGFLADVVV